jgi:hypothetical protein
VQNNFYSVGDWLMQVDIHYQDGHGYFLFSLLIPSLDKYLRSTLAELENIERYVDITRSDFKIFDVKSSHGGENSEIIISVPTVSKNVSTVIKTLKLIETRQREQELIDSKEAAKRDVENRAKRI